MIIILIKVIAFLWRIIFTLFLVGRRGKLKYSYERKYNSILDVQTNL